MRTEDILTRHGPMRVIEGDVWISRCLKETGEHSQSELNLMELVLGIQTNGRYDGVVIDGGAFIGDHTIPLSRMCRRLYAFEPQAETREILKYNLDQNHITNVEVMPFALGDRVEATTYNPDHTEVMGDGSIAHSPGGTQVGVGTEPCQLETLDHLGLRADFIKADIEGMEIPMLAGGFQTLRETRPTLFLEYDTVIQAELLPLKECLSLMNYKSYPMTFPMWSPDNFNKTPNTFGSTVAKMMLGVPGVGEVCRGLTVTHL
jgi:FkbM family methyltransferase